MSTSTRSSVLLSLSLPDSGDLILPAPNVEPDDIVLRAVRQQPKPWRTTLSMILLLVEIEELVYEQLVLQSQELDSRQTYKAWNPPDASIRLLESPNFVEDITRAEPFFYKMGKLKARLILRLMPLKIKTMVEALSTPLRLTLIRSFESMALHKDIAGWIEAYQIATEERQPTKKRTIEAQSKPGGAKQRTLRWVDQSSQMHHYAMPQQSPGTSKPKTGNTPIAQARPLQYNQELLGKGHQHVQEQEQHQQHQHQHQHQHHHHHQQHQQHQQQQQQQLQQQHLQQQQQPLLQLQLQQAAQGQPYLMHQQHQGPPLPSTSQGEGEQYHMFQQAQSEVEQPYDMFQQPQPQPQQQQQQQHLLWDTDGVAGDFSFIRR